MEEKAITPYSITLIMLAVLFSLFSGWEMGGETWGYWFFARVFSETGRFIIFDRSPLYVLYLNLFTWLPYPHSVTVEYVVTTVICVLALYLFFSKFISRNLALLAACLWIPLLQAAEPPVQKLALACSLLAVILREKDNRFRIVASYSLLLFAYAFRQTYITFFLIFVLFDGLRLIKTGNIKKILYWRPVLKTDWPILLTLGLFIWFAFFQSPSPWNNVWFTDTQWFPNAGKSMLDGGGIQSINWIYIQNTYGSFEGHDFYFTNQEAFGGASSFFEALFYNPVFSFAYLYTNLKTLVIVLTEPFFIPCFGVNYTFYLSKLISLVLLGYGAFRAAITSHKKLFLLASLAVLFTLVLSIPKTRYIVPAIPIYVMAVSWYSMQARAWLEKGYPNLIIDNFKNEYIKRRIRYLVQLLPAVLLLFWVSSSSFTFWVNTADNIARSFPKGEYNILENEGYSMKRNYDYFITLTRDCEGIISLEPLFFGAFLPIESTKVYSIWEIPPFGVLDDSYYQGLHPSRVDCVLVSHYLQNDIGYATNIRLRYQGYIEPYVEQIIMQGATAHDIPNYGIAYIIEPCFMK